MSELEFKKLEQRVAQLEQVRQVESPYLTRAEAAAFVRCSIRMIDECLQRGELARHRFGGVVLVLRSELESRICADRRPVPSPGLNRGGPDGMDDRG